MAAFKYLKDLDEIKDVVAKLNKQPWCVIDTETTGTDPHVCDLVDIQLGLLDDSVFMFSGEHIRALDDLETQIVGHNLKYDIIVLKRHGVNLIERGFHDTMLMHHLYDENSSHALGTVASQFGIESSYKDDFWKKYSSYTEAPFDERLDYACSDIVVTDAVYRKLLEVL